MPRQNRNKGVVVYLPEANPWTRDMNHVGEMSVRDLVGLVLTKEFPARLDTMIKIGDIEGNEGVNKTITVTAHRPGDVVLSVDMHCGDEYDPESEEDSDGA